MNVDRIATRIASTQECDSAIADRLIQMCKNTGREVQSVTVKPIHGDCASLGYGTMVQLKAVLAYDVPVLISPYQRRYRC